MLFLDFIQIHWQNENSFYTNGNGKGRQSRNFFMPSKRNRTFLFYISFISSTNTTIIPLKMIWKLCSRKNCGIISRPKTHVNQSKLFIPVDQWRPWDQIVLERCHFWCTETELLKHWRNRSSKIGLMPPTLTERLKPSK